MRQAGDVISEALWLLGECISYRLNPISIANTRGSGKEVKELKVYIEHPDRNREIVKGAVTIPNMVGHSRANIHFHIEQIW